jgi:hypothetical protein
MVTRYPRHAEADAMVVTRPEAVGGIGTRVLDWVRQTYCGLHGHDNMLHFERDRLFLQCVSCGRQTPGWELNETPRPVVTVRAEPHAHRVMRPHLVSARRIA